MINQITKQFIEYWSMERSISHLMEVAKSCYFISIGIDEINDGIKNPRRMRITILQLIYFAICTFIVNLFSTTNYFYSFIKLDILPSHFQLIMFGVFGFASIWCFAFKIDILISEIKSNLSPFRIFYFLINNIKSKHRLTDFNYNRLAIWSRIVIIVNLDYGLPLFEVIAMGLAILIAILSQKSIWILMTILFIPHLLIGIIAFSFVLCFDLILFSYYKIRFDQIHSSIKSISNSKLMINKKRENQFIDLIGEHSTVSIEIHKLNLVLRRSQGVMSMVLSTVRIIILHLLIRFNNNIFLNMMLSIAFCILVVFGFALSYLLTLQIKSAHQSDKLINSILIKSKMRFKLKLKVIYNFVK